MPLSDFQKALFTSANASDLYKQMQNDANRCKEFFEFMRKRVDKYNKISATDAETHLQIPIEIRPILGTFRNMLNELVQLYDEDITTITSAPKTTVEELYSILR